MQISKISYNFNFKPLNFKGKKVNSSNITTKDLQNLPYITPTFRINSLSHALTSFENKKLLYEIIDNDLKKDDGIILNVKSSFLNTFPLKFAASKKPTLIAICGESASGKTTLNNVIKQYAQANDAEITFLNTDNYFKDISEGIKKAGSFDEFLKTGYDLDSPESFYVDELRENLIALKKGETVLGRKYQPDGTGISKKDALEYSPNKIVIVEGTISALDELRDLFDATIYVQTDDETRKERYIQRALKERNQDEIGALEQWNYIYKAGEKYVQPLKDKCDIVINGEFDEEYIKEIVEKLSHLQKEN